MAYDSTEKGGCSAQMKCPHCGQTMNLMAEASQDGKSQGMDEDMTEGKPFDEDEFRQAMSPRNDEQPA